MLDQNTDRMWFVIGAVLVGAAVIAAAMYFFGGSDSIVFEYLGNFFSDLQSKGDGVLDNIKTVPAPVETINLLKSVI